MVRTVLHFDVYVNSLYGSYNNIQSYKHVINDVFVSDPEVNLENKFWTDVG